MAASTTEQRAKTVLKHLRKREPRTLAELSSLTGIAVKALTLPISHLCITGQAVAHRGRPTKYTKA